MRTDDLRRGFPFLDPVHYDRKPIDGATAGAAAAVEHARNHEEAVKVAGFYGAEAFAYGAVVFDSRLRVHLLISPACILHNLSATLLQRCEIWILRVEYDRGIGNPCRVGIEVEHSVVPGRTRRRRQHGELHLV